MITGALLMVSPFLIDRLENLTVGTTGVELRLSVTVAELGAPKTALLLDHSDLAAAVESYAFVRTVLTDPRHLNAKVVLQDSLVAQAVALANREKFSATEVRLLFREGPPIVRTLALGLMQGNPDLADGTSIFTAVSRSQTGNEQYHALVLARLCWRDLSPADRGAILAAVDADPFIAGDADRREAANQLRALDRKFRRTSADDE
ncbi:hypothetical protein E3T55_11670 [Cryobacterium frigoriphilum]|uniref:Uncharacterized protein n=1 Tax=Cryobacterium frigoriphilum TaxID=1259150 RepID=A0A4R8ZZA6_9MICO|nr:hypothetical protein [Cryobacterium frigoriphilum]TFD49127.1 hypothetical protein E3T55_11670 [Cryobacterium frigoriphilum]